MEKIKIYRFLLLLFTFVIIGFSSCSDDGNDTGYTILMSTPNTGTNNDGTDNNETNNNDEDNTPTITIGEAIDLGLTVKWASCNVGATQPWEYGGYYAWGETEEKNSYHKSDYLYYNNGSYTYIGRDISGTQYDVATVKWGGSWRMPTKTEQDELRNYCTWRSTTFNGVNGWRVTGPNGNSIFLPAAGYRYDTGVDGQGSVGTCWSSSLYSYSDHHAEGLHLYGSYDYNEFWEWACYRSYGCTVRPVCTNNNDNTNNNRVVNLGLSVKWASCNVGATKPEEYGGYYAWGETEEKSNYSWRTYKYCNGTYDSLTKYCTSSSYGTIDNKTTLEPTDDVATVNWGGSWRMPTKAELDELRNKCTWRWTTLNGVNGYRATGPNGNSIFLPAAGYRNDTKVNGQGSCGACWSSSLNNNYIALTLMFYGSYGGWDYDLSRDFGFTVRPVCD